MRGYRNGLIALYAVAVAAATPAVAQDMYIYPAKGQTQDQQNRDRYECNNWAIQQSGFDPARPVAQGSTAPPTTQSTPMRGATRGAAVGAVGGAIGGDAGKGAAVGAATGALFGGMRRRDEAAQQQQYQQQQSAAYSQQRAAYDRAMTACLEGRGYTIK